MEIEQPINGEDTDNLCEMKALCTQLSSSSLDNIDKQESNEFCEAFKLS